MKSLQDVVNEVATDIRKSLMDKYPPPPADLFDEEKYPFGVAPGENKGRFMTCALCSKPASETPKANMSPAFLFKDYESAVEYRISGMCQACQDMTFLCEDGE